ncbi:capsule polysaccharide transporter [Roseobacter cerasinus]|uniref:Capsule polysaccharide transporter n=1 Tax=Roseobacter cerasinus TaxID=2602289 RepID=A0A640VLA7_9RHOB|nr:capsule biosynthesis protein [Roseobacter cerasinus]GFE48394.1 capsule polysaccharide transporter [Roseobacter cerasinus]
MTTKPTARKFRIRRSTPPSDATPAADAAKPAADTPQARNKESPETTAETPSPKPKPEQKPSTSEAAALDDIRSEGLTGRQLRMARRVAHKHGLSPKSDLDAVRLLRQQGIEPFQRSTMLELVVPNTPEDAARKGHIQLPQTTPADDPRLPSTETLSPAELRDRQISEIQKDIARRRRRKSLALLGRLSFFVFLPTLLAAWYFYAVATPMYATKSEFLILQADSAGGSGVGGLLSGTQFATSSDSIAVQAFLTSKPAMLRLDDEVGFKSHFAQAGIDPIQRLSEGATNEEAYRRYQKNIKVGYDPTEGMIRMEVIAADPEISARFSRALISYAEENVNGLSAQKRDDQMAEARASFDNAVDERRQAQEALVTLQLQGDTLDPEAVIAGLRSQINQVELLLLEKELELAALLDNARPNQSRVDGARGDVRRLNDQLDELNARMTDASQGENSLAQLSVRIQMAQADLATRDMLLQSALQQMEQTRMEANRQVRYLTVSVEPVPSQEPSYPRKFENTLVAFLVFAGIYLMVSLTASILREQVTS